MYSVRLYKDIYRFCVQTKEYHDLLSQVIILHYVSCQTKLTAGTHFVQGGIL